MGGSVIVIVIVIVVIVVVYCIMCCYCFQLSSAAAAAAGQRLRWVGVASDGHHLPPLHIVQCATVQLLHKLLPYSLR